LKLSNNTATNVKFSVYNVLGEKVFEEKYSGIYTKPNYTLRLDNVNPGVYFVKIKLDNRLITSKFIIN